MKESITLERVLAVLNTACVLDSAKDVAGELGISEQYLSDIRRGRRALPDSVALALGFKKVVTYEFIE